MVHVQQERYNCLISKIVIYLPQASQTQILHFVLYHLHKSMSSVVKKDCVHFISSFCDKLLFRLSIGSFSVNTILLWASATKFKLFFCTQASTTKSNKQSCFYSPDEQAKIQRCFFLLQASSASKFREEYVFLATLVALHFTPVSKWVGRSFGLAQLGACELVLLRVLRTRCVFLLGPKFRDKDVSTLRCRWQLKPEYWPRKYTVVNIAFGGFSFSVDRCYNHAFGALKVHCCQHCIWGL